MKRTEQLLVAQTIYKCILECHKMLELSDLDSRGRYGWQCREAELEDFAKAMCQAFAGADETFVPNDFLRVALPT